MSLRSNKLFSQTVKKNKFMKNKNALARYRLIDSRITMKQLTAPTLEDLILFVSEKLGTSISEASIQKDIFAMRNNDSLGFYAPIEYDKKLRGYIYKDADYSINNIAVSEEDLQGLEIAVGILEQFKEIPAIKLFDDAITKIASSVKHSREKIHSGGILLLDRPKRYLGIEHMNNIVDAIRGKNIMRIVYQPFTKKESKKHTVHPYFIKEYNGRMYLIAKDIHPTKQSKFLTFALDRMSDTITMNTTFQEEILDKENYFNAAIGISLTGIKPEAIQLRFEPQQANYLKSQPIHHSQKIIKETKNDFIVSLQLVINYELKSLLLSFGDKVKVAKPASLANEISRMLQTAFLQY
jgi:predicted DNA-binding transcriptional regulator YafY